RNPGRPAGPGVLVLGRARSPHVPDDLRLMRFKVSAAMEDEVFRRCDEIRPAIRSHLEQNRWWRSLSPEEKTDPLTLALRLSYRKAAGDPIDHLLHVFRACEGHIPYVSICNHSMFVVGGLRATND